MTKRSKRVLWLLFNNLISITSIISSIPQLTYIPSLSVVLDVNFLIMKKRSSSLCVSLNHLRITTVQFFSFFSFPWTDGWCIAIGWTAIKIVLRLLGRVGISWLSASLLYLYLNLLSLYHIQFCLLQLSPLYLKSVSSLCSLSLALVDREIKWIILGLRSSFSNSIQTINSWKFDNYWWNKNADSLVLLSKLILLLKCVDITTVSIPNLFPAFYLIVFTHLRT